MCELANECGTKDEPTDARLEEAMRPLVVTAVLLALLALALAGALAALVRGQRPALLGRPLGVTA